MNPYSGEIEYFNPSRAIPRGWLVLTEDEAREFATLPNDERLTRYIEKHRTDKCGACGTFIGSHHLNKFKECAANELARIDTERHEQQSKQFFDSLPVRKLDRETLRQDLNQHIEAMRTGK